MKLHFFGDSYDIVKKSLIAWLSKFGMWSAHPILTEPVNPDHAASFSRFLGVDLISDEVLSPQTDELSTFHAAERRAIYFSIPTRVFGCPLAEG
jgi:hypothetical protein